MSLICLIAAIVMIKSDFRLSGRIMLVASIIQLIADVVFVVCLLASV